LHFLIIYKHGAHFSQNACRMSVGWRIDPVVHPFTFAARRNNSRTSKVGEVSRDLWLINAQHLNQKADANLFVANQIDYPQSRSIGQGFEEQFNAVLIITH
jgi:hypothetical protein